MTAEKILAFWLRIIELFCGRDHSVVVEGTTMEKAIINFPGFWNSVGTCGVSFDRDAGIAVVVELDGHRGTSVTNAAEFIAPIVAKDLMNKEIGTFQLFEVYQHRIKDGVDYDASTVTIRNGAPDWTPVSEGDQERIKPFLNKWEMRRRR